MRYGGVYIHVIPSSQIKQLLISPGWVRDHKPKRMGPEESKSCKENNQLYVDYKL